MSASALVGRRAIAALLVIASGLFLWGALAERASAHSERPGTDAGSTVTAVAPERSGSEPAGAHATTGPVRDADGDSHDSATSITPSTTHVEQPRSDHDATTITVAPKAAGSDTGDGDSRDSTTRPAVTTVPTARPTAATTTTSSTEKARSDHDSTATTAVPESGADGDVHSGVSGTAPHKETSVETRELLGINVEALGFIWFGAIVSLILAGVVLLGRDRWSLVVVVALAVVFVVLEIAEVLHQRNEHYAGLVALAVLAGLCHLGAGLLAARGALRTPTPEPA